MWVIPEAKKIQEASQRLKSATLSCTHSLFLSFSLFFSLSISVCVCALL